MDEWDKDFTNDDPWSEKLEKIFNTRFSVSSSDGLLTVTAKGDETLCSAGFSQQFLTKIKPDVLSTSRTATQVCREAIETARKETAKAMADLPGMNPQLRQLLLGGL